MIRVLQHNTMRRRAGFSCVVVMIALAVAVVLATGALSRQSTMTAIQRQLCRDAQGRMVAESALDLGIAQTQEDPAWRDGFDGAALLGGTASLSVTETDPDTGVLRLDALGVFEGARHRVSATVAPPRPARTALMLVPDPDRLEPGERDRAEFLRAHAWAVRLMRDSAGASALRQAADEADVVYLCPSTRPHALDDKLDATHTGIVLAQPGLVREFDLVKSLLSLDLLSTCSGRIKIVDPGHPITRPLGWGWVKVAQARQPLVSVNVSKTYGEELANDGGLLGLVNVLGLLKAPMLIALDRGDRVGFRLFRPDPRSPGRRVMMPWGGDRAFRMGRLTGEGRVLLARSLAWAGGYDPDAPPAGEPGRVRWDEAAP